MTDALRTRRPARAWSVAVVAVSAAMGMAGCASTPSDQDVEGQLRTAGASVRGIAGEFQVFAVNADSRMAAWTLAAQAAESGPLPLSRQLNRRMELAAKQGRMLVVGGPYPRLTRVVCLDALRLDRDRKLAGLTLVYVGSVDSATDVRQEARARNVRFIRRELP